MHKFRVRHLLLATAAFSAFFGWRQLDTQWKEFITVVGLDGEVVRTKDGQFTRLFYSKRSVRAGADRVEVNPPLVSKRTAYWLVGASFVLATAAITFLPIRKASPVHLTLQVVQSMAIAVALFELPNLLEFVLDLIDSLRGNLVIR